MYNPLCADGDVESAPSPSIWRMSSHSHLRTREGIPALQGFSLVGHSYHGVLVSTKAQEKATAAGTGAGSGHRILEHLETAGGVRR